ncbi:stage III sporulation protein AE [Dehalobacterium formicoaceticum]|uniref:stage III sporulation protein AE n=1 Tax=Dehalobacterium formicoaceticum TaxID=51515 RepID=UPI000B7D55B1|nr:stage III sporulation protein AE [Dehalobacterium formicoaceticum]
MIVKKWYATLILSLFLLGCIPPHLQAAEDIAPVYEEEQFILSEIEEYVNQVDQQIKEHIPELSLKKIYEDIKSGEFSWNIKDIILSLLGYLFKEVVANGELMTQLLILAVASAVLANLQGAFTQGNIAILGHSVIYLVLISIALNSFSLAVNAGKESIDAMTSFLYGIMPVLFSLLAAMGNMTSVLLIQPTMVMMLSFSTFMIKTVVFPLIYFMAVLNIVSQISPHFKVTRLAGLFKDVSMGLFGIVMTVFVGFLGMQGLAGSVANGLTLKAAKFATGAFIPVVGRSLADAMDTVIGTSLILKNGIGIVGVIGIFLLCIIPGIKIIAISLIYRVVAAVLQPFGENQLSEALHSLANSLLLIFAAVAAVGLMFFFVIAITIGTANISMMLR